MLVNATPKLGSIGGMDRVRRVLDSRGLVHRLPAETEAILDGRAISVGDLDAIREAFFNGDSAVALERIDADQKRILASVASGDPIPALAELSQWRALIAASENHEETAINWFRAAYRFNPAWAPDKKLASSPMVKKLFKEAKQEATEAGKLRIEVEPDSAQIRVDGKEIHRANEKFELPVGVHLIIVSADGRAPYAELLEIKPGKAAKLAVTLPVEGNDDRLARLVDATVSAAPGKNRLKLAKPLAKLAGVNKLLYVEDASTEHFVLRLYDVEARRVSSAIDLDATATAAVITSRVMAAIDGETMLDPGGGGAAAPAAWYNHWYVWVGAAVLVGVAFGTYEYATRQPTSVRF